MSKLTRRRFLQGTLNGSAVTVALPFLNCFLNDNGTALASGAPIPLRFGTWSWGLGMSEAVFVPKTTGANYELPEEIAALAPVQQHINLYTNFHVFKDVAPNLCHHSGPPPAPSPAACGGRRHCLRQYDCGDIRRKPDRRSR